MVRLGVVVAVSLLVYVYFCSHDVADLCDPYEPDLYELYGLVDVQGDFAVPFVLLRKALCHRGDVGELGVVELMRRSRDRFELLERQALNFRFRAYNRFRFARQVLETA